MVNKKSEQKRRGSIIVSLIEGAFRPQQTIQARTVLEDDNNGHRYQVVLTRACRECVSSLSVTKTSVHEKMLIA